MDNGASVTKFFFFVFFFYNTLCIIAMGTIVNETNTGVHPIS